MDQKNLRKREEKRREKQKEHYDRRHGVRAKEEFGIGDDVWIKDLRLWGKVASKAPTPRSYNVKTPQGVYRRNSFHLTPSPQKKSPVHVTPEAPRDPIAEEEPALENNEPEQPEEIQVEIPPVRQPSPPIAVRKTKRTIVPPKRLIEEIGNRK